MYWYRQRPHEAYTFPLPSLSSQHHLRLAWCHKIRCNLNYRTGESFCDSCYRFSLNRLDCRILYIHLLSDGMYSPVYKCANCHRALTIRYPLSTCHLCTRVHLNLLTHFEEHGLDVNNLADPILLHVSGTNFDI